LLNRLFNAANLTNTHNLNIVLDFWTTAAWILKQSLLKQ